MNYEENKQSLSKGGKFGSTLSSSSRSSGQSPVSAAPIDMVNYFNFC